MAASEGCAILSKRLIRRIGRDDREIRVWDVDSGAKVTVIGNLIANVQSIQFSPDGTKILAGCYDGTVRVWDLNGVEMTCHDGHEGG